MMSTHVRSRIGALSMTSILLAIGSAVFAEPYELSKYTIDGGGTMFSVAGEYELSGTIGQPDAGFVQSDDYELTGGFWQSEVENCSLQSTALTWPMASLRATTGPRRQSS